MHSSGTRATLACLEVDKNDYRAHYVLWHEILVLIPALDLDVVDGHRAECADEGCGQTGIRDERDVEVYGCTTDIVSVGQLLVREVLRNVDHQVELLVGEHVHSCLVLACKLRILRLTRPDDTLGRDAVLSKVLR